MKDLRCYIGLHDWQQETERLGWRKWRCGRDGCDSTKSYGHSYI